MGDREQFELSEANEAAVGDVMRVLGRMPLNILGYLAVVLLENLEVPEDLVGLVRGHVRLFLHREREKGEVLHGG